MSRRPRSSVLFALALLAAPLHPQPAAAALQTRHVVILAVDGARFSETLGDPLALRVPHLAHDLAPLGAQVNEFRNLGPTITVPGMSALMTGTWQNILNDGTERPHSPTICEYLRQQKGTPDSLVRVVARKPKLEVLAASDHPAYGAAYGGVAHAGFASDTSTYNFGKNELLRYRPTLMLLHLGDTDFLGHANDWPGYLNSIRIADSLIFDLWNTIESDTGLAGRTTLFVTNDHGRHLDSAGGFQNHGDGCAGCRRIFMVMLGPDSKHGFLGPGYHDQRDIACTTGLLLGFTTPLATGVVMDDLMLVSTQVLDAPPPVLAAAGMRLFPNPAHGSVTARLTRALPAGARLDVLDATGRRVAAMHAGAGALEWVWDGRLADGRRAAPGLYLVRAHGAGVELPARTLMVR